MLADGQVVQTGQRGPDRPGYDLRGAIIGSEGMFGIVTKITVALMPKPEDARTMVAIYDTLEDAGETVTDLLRNAIIPAAAEIMDNVVVRAVEAANHLGYPDDAGAVLLIEVDGLPEGLDDLAATITAACWSAHARDVRLARTEEERVALWKGRKGAAGALGRIAPSKYQQDGTVPRSRLPEALHYIGEVGGSTMSSSAPCCMPATATCTPTSCSTHGSPAPCRPPLRPAPTFCGVVWTWAERSPASTAWAWKSKT